MTLEEKLIHAGHDLVEARAIERNKRMWIRGLAKDALDAIEVDCPHVAISRLKAIIKRCEDE